MRFLLNEIHFNNLRGDIFGGITAAVIALPMALAFGVASGAGPEAGLYGAILVGLFASLFGGSPTLMSEPTGPMTVVFTAVIVELTAADPVNGMAMAFTVVVLAGLFQILFGILKLGKYITLMPYPVVSGFMSGIGIILIILQIAPILGHAKPDGGTFEVLQGLPALFSQIQGNEFLLAAITIAILFFMPKKMKRVLPPQLIALVGVTLVSIWFFSNEDVRRIGEIPMGLPEFRMPMFSIDQWQTILVDAVVLGLLGCIDALLTSVVADSLTRTRHKSDKELIGQGVGNVMSGLFGGLPGAGATMGTVVGIQAGSRTAVAGLVRASILIVVVLWAAGITSIIPLAVLSGIALKVGVDIIDWKFLSRAHLMSYKGALITYAVIILTVFVDLIVAVGLGLFVANIITITRLSELQEDTVKAITDPDQAEEAGLEFESIEKDLFRAAGGHVLYMHLHGTMIFGVSRLISRKNSSFPECAAIIIDLREVKHLGVSAALTIEEAVLDMVGARRQAYLVVDEGKQPYNRLKKMGVLGKMRQERIVHELKEALGQIVGALRDESNTEIVAKSENEDEQQEEQKDT